VTLGKHDGHDAYIGLGSNLDDPVAQVRTALEALNRIVSTRWVRQSSLYRTAPGGPTPTSPTSSMRLLGWRPALPPCLLHELLELERGRGRVRAIPNGPRTLDMDLLLFETNALRRTVGGASSAVHERAFVLVPLFEIAPEISIPGRGTVSD